MSTVKLNEKSQNIIKKWSEIYKKKTGFVNDAIIEFDKYLSMSLRPSENPDYDEFIEKKKEVE